MRHIPGEADPRRKVILVHRQERSGLSWIARDDHLPEQGSGRIPDEVRHLVIGFGIGINHFVPKSQSYSERACDRPLVLYKGAEIFASLHKITDRAGGRGV